MRAVRLPAREIREPGIRVTAVLVNEACCRMQPDPFVETHLSGRATRHFEIAREFEAVEEIQRLLPEKACFAGAIVYPNGLLILILVPDRSHPCNDCSTHRALEKMRGGKRTAIVHHADQE